ncbi:MAG: 2,3-bisphosphoglycerate-independent phosphoglycerate mutase, partial [Bacteroidota bacterium]
DPLAALSQSYEDGVTDEFVKPIVVTENGSPTAVIEEGDVVLCFNFRTDRGREITIALTQQAFPEQNMVPLNLYYVTMTKYDDEYKNVKVVIDNSNLPDTLGEVLERHNLKQIRIAETEKYPHVTFFFSGGRENPFNGESRLMCPSPKDVKTYDLKPEMSAWAITDTIIPELQKQEASFVCLNYANPDMVGHTGVFSAVVKAVETVDSCLAKLLPVALENGYSAIIIADHGNSELMVNPDGSPNTAHTTSLVPCIIMDPDFEIGKGRAVKDGKLGDIAPTILKMLGVEKPAIMTGEALV